MQHLQKLNIQNFSPAAKCYVWQEEEFQIPAFAAVVGKGKDRKGALWPQGFGMCIGAVCAAGADHALTLLLFTSPRHVHQWKEKPTEQVRARG